MALNNPSTLAYPPTQVPIVDIKSGQMTQAWIMWFQQMYVRIGGTTPVNPTIQAIKLVQGNPFSFYIVPAGPSVTWNGATYSTNQVIPYYQSGISVSTIIDSFLVRNTSLTGGLINVYVVPYAKLPSSANLLVNNLPIPANSVSINITQLAGLEIGSGAYLAVTASPSQQIITELTGRVLT